MSLESPSKLQSRSMSGISLLEYIIVLALLGVIFLSYYDQLQPKSSQFYSEITDGLETMYPSGYYSS